MNVYLLSEIPINCQAKKIDSFIYNARNGKYLKIFEVLIKI